jgi:3-deoxy-D-manno-octulosonic-acid transferase
MRIFYSFGILLYRWAIGLASLFNTQAKQWIDGRSKQSLPAISPHEKWSWVHAASLGEFEQGRPIIEYLKKNYPHHKILLTFFSPSGYEVRKNYAQVDFVCYLPIDLPWKMKAFVEHFHPKAVIFVKYEYWYNLLNILAKRKIPYYFISAIYRDTQVFFKPWGFWFRKHLAKATYIFCQDEDSLKRLQRINISQAEVAGDTRFDRVYQIAQAPQLLTKVERFCGKAFILVAGSSWPEDEQKLEQLLAKLNPHTKLIIAPHKVDESHIQQLLKLFSSHKAILYSQLNEDSNMEEYKVLIVDTIGLLAHLYQFAHVAYIGGGFGAGIHNTLEAAVYAIPVVFGPKYEKFREAKELIHEGAAFSIKTAEELKSIVNKLQNSEVNYQAAAKASRHYIHQNLGASERILKKMME